MDPRLMEVARNGDIDGLYGLLGEDPFILENVEKIPFTNTPLHWAVENGHTCFVEEITNLKPSFSLMLNQDGFSPLHLASKFGHVDILKMLLKGEQRLKKLMKARNVDGSLCTLKGKEKMTPLHCAALDGRVNVLKVLLSNCPDSITALTVRKETALHLAVKSGQLEALKGLVNWIGKHGYNYILQWKDQEGNTVLHLATSQYEANDQEGNTVLHLASSQYEANGQEGNTVSTAGTRDAIVEVLLHTNRFLVRKAVQVNARNNAGQTALDLLPREPRPRERIRTILRSAGAKQGQDRENQQTPVPRSFVMNWLPKLPKSKHWYRYFSLKVDKDAPSATRNTLLVVVVLIATATYHTGLNPPGGYWNNTNRDSTIAGDYAHYAGEPIWFTYSPETYNLVMLFNFAGFILSLVLIYNLTAGYPLRGPLLVALILMLLTYSWSTPLFYNGPAGSDYFSFKPGNKMLWVPIVLAVTIWAITGNWMRQVWRKFLLLMGRLSHA